MCFYIHPNYKRIKIAKRSIVCYKRFLIKNDCFISPYVGFSFEKGQCYNEDSMKKVGMWWGDIITLGFHSYSSLKAAHKNMCIYEKIVKCIIPQEAKYYYNPQRKEYVSDYLIIGTDADIIK